MDTMIQIAEHLKKNVVALLPATISPGIIEHIEKEIDHQLTTDDMRKNIVKCQLWEADFEENWIKFQVPADVVAKGFHYGKATIDFTGIQE